MEYPSCFDYWSTAMKTKFITKEDAARRLFGEAGRRILYCHFVGLAVKTLDDQNSSSRTSVCCRSGSTCFTNNVYV